MAQTIPVKPDRAELASRNPVTGAEIGRAPIATPEEVARAVGRAREAQRSWSQALFRERGRVVMKARKIILKELENIALLISQETGKPIAEAIAMELTPTLDLMQYFARHTGNLLRRERISIGQYVLMGRSSYIFYKPLGVVGIISPWNFPWATPLDEVVIALMAGNSVVLKPSELTPLTGLQIKEVFRRAGLPDGLLEVVAGDGSIGAALAAVWGAFANCGQACAAVERCYVDKSIAPQFTDAVVKETKRLRQNVGAEKDADIGSMTSERQLRIVEDHVLDARTKGATVLTGGQRPPNLTGPFYEPTVLTNVDHEMEVMRDETFGPVLPIMTFKTDDEAVRLANDTIYGLTASVFTKDIARGKKLAERIDAGTVMVNEVLYTHGIAQTPWGGVKQSGIGRTHGRAGLLEMVSPQHIHLNRLSFIPDLWWFNYTPQAGRLFRGLARRFASGSILQTALLLPQMIRRWLDRRGDA